jgi:hypothetical protein
VDVVASADLRRLIDGRNSGTTILMNTHQQVQPSSLCKSDWRRCGPGQRAQPSGPCPARAGRPGCIADSSHRAAHAGSLAARQNCLSFACCPAI